MLYLQNSYLILVSAMHYKFSLCGENPKLDSSYTKLAASNRKCGDVAIKKVSDENKTAHGSCKDDQNNIDDTNKCSETDMKLKEIAEENFKCEFFKLFDWKSKDFDFNTNKRPEIDLVCYISHAIAKELRNRIVRRKLFEQFLAIEESSNDILKINNGGRGLYIKFGNNSIINEIIYAVTHRLITENDRNSEISTENLKIISDRLIWMTIHCMIISIALECNIFYEKFFFLAKSISQKQKYINLHQERVNFIFNAKKHERFAGG